MSKTSKTAQTLQAAQFKGELDAALGREPMFTAVQSRVSAAYIRGYESVTK